MEHKQFRVDPYSKQAKKLGYRSRASLKLVEMHQKHQIFKPGMKVLDMGCAPGGWTQVAYDMVGKQGLVVGIDILPTEPYKNVQFIQGDFNHDLPNIPFDLVISDICPNKTGHLFVDQCNMFNLCSEVVHIIKDYPKFLCKFFNGEKEPEFTSLLKENFKNVKKLKPQASRQVSGEFYYWCFD